MKLNFSMAEKYFQSKTDNSETKMTNFFQSVCTNSVSINLIVSELSKEKIKRSTLDNDKREMKCKMKELVEKLNATEILIDISNAAIQVLEKTIKDSGNALPWMHHDITPNLSLIPKLEGNGTPLIDPIGSFNATAAISGTKIKFNPPIGTDTEIKGKVSTNISTMLQCITGMKEYENKSFEELRMEDYSIHKGGAGLAVGIGFENTTRNTGDLFGRNAAASTSAFSFSNTTQLKSMFDTTGATNTFGSSGGLFGLPVQTQTPGLFGQSAPSTAAVPAFNFGASTETSLLQQNNLQMPLFGQTTVGTGIFGSTTTTQQSIGFGTNAAISSFGAKNQQTITVASVSSDAPTEKEDAKKKTLLEEKSREELIKIGKEQFNLFQKAKENSNAQNAEPVGASGGASAAEESVTEDEDEEEETEELIFEKRVTLEVFDDAENKFKVEGMGYLKIVYDDSSFGYRVFMDGDDGRLLCEHLIAVQTCLRTDGKTAIWAAIDYCMEPVTRRQFRVTFSSMEALNEFSKHFEKGKEIAIKSPIVEKSD